MARDAAYRKAEKKIEAALRTGATALDLSNMNLTELPGSLGQLTQLQNLYIHDNQLTALPESLGQLTQLRELYLGANNLTFLPDWLGQFTQLQTLLPLEPPPDCDEPDDEDRTRIRYEFAVVPGPLLPKLLVRTFTLIQGERRWRRGAILHLYLDSNGRSQGCSRKAGITSSLLRLLFKVTTSCER